MPFSSNLLFDPKACRSAELEAVGVNVFVRQTGTRSRCNLPPTPRVAGRQSSPLRHRTAQQMNGCFLSVVQQNNSAFT